MAISDKTRKELWAKSAGRCAFCRHELVMAGQSDPNSVVGDECHIISIRPSGPRHGAGVVSEADGYDNLILLCRTHHKQVDDQPNEFSVDVLRTIKVAHERWVSDALAKSARRQAAGQAAALRGIVLLPRIKTGKQLLDLIANTQVYILDNDELSTIQEADEVGGFFSQIRDLYDILSDLDPADVVRNQIELNDDIGQLETSGFLVFGTHQPRTLKFGQTVETFPVATICAIRTANRAIIDVEGQQYLVTLDRSTVT